MKTAEKNNSNQAIDKVIPAVIVHSSPIKSREEIKPARGINNRSLF
jgi:hypothetical protein